MALTKVLVASTDATNCSIDDSTCNLCVTLKKGQHPNNNIAKMATKVVAAMAAVVHGKVLRAVMGPDRRPCMF
jgi:hypothetical protein